MTDSAIFQKALTRRKELRQEVTRLDTFIKTYQELEKTSVSTIAKGSLTGKSVPDALAAIFATRDEPIPLRELSNLLAEHGRPPGGENPIANLSSILSRDPRFENVSGRGWRLTHPQEDAPPATTDEASNSPGLAGSPGEGLQPMPGRFDSD